MDLTNTMTPRQYNTAKSGGRSAFAIKGVMFFSLQIFWLRSKAQIEFKFYVVGNATSFLSTVSSNLLFALDEMQSLSGATNMPLAIGTTR